MVKYNNRLVTGVTREYIYNGNSNSLNSHSVLRLHVPSIDNLVVMSSKKCDGLQQKENEFQLSELNIGIHGRFSAWSIAIVHCGRNPRSALQNVIQVKRIEITLINSMWRQSEMEVSSDYAHTFFNLYRHAAALFDYRCNYTYRPTGVSALLILT